MQLADDIVARVVRPIGNVLTDTENLISRYIVATKEQTCALALHTAHTHAFEAADVTLYINVTSAAPESGRLDSSRS